MRRTALILGAMALTIAGCGGDSDEPPLSKSDRTTCRLAKVVALNAKSDSTGELDGFVEELRDRPRAADESVRELVRFAIDAAEDTSEARDARIGRANDAADAILDRCNEPDS